MQDQDIQFDPMLNPINKIKDIMGFNKRDRPENIDDWNDEELVEHFTSNELSSEQADNIIESLVPLNKITPISDTDRVNITDQSYLDLEIFEDNMHNKSETIFNRLSKCKTKYGDWYMRYCLQNPLTNVSKLKNRQKFIEYFSNNNDNLTDIRNNLSEIKNIEQDVFWFWNGDDEQYLESLNDLVYFRLPSISRLDPNPIVNKQDGALTVYALYKLYASIPLIVLAPFIPILIIFFFMKFLLKIDLSLKLFMKMVFAQLFSQGDMLKKQCDAYFGEHSILGTLLKLGSQFMWFFMYFYNISTSWKIREVTFKLVNLLKQKTHNIGKFLNNVRGIYDKIKDYPKEIAFEEFGFRNKHFCENFTEIDNIFGHNYEEKSDGIFNIGKVLSAHYQFSQIKHKFIKILQFVGLIDYHQSIVSLLETEKFCVTKYIKNNDKPNIICKGSIHPYLYHNGVANNITINSNKTRCVLITGPNAAGKSTFIKAMILNVLLSQTLGISASKEFKLTPFYTIQTYLHIPDCKGRESLFEAEMHRSKQYIDSLRNMEKGKFAFLVMDELFSSTNYVEGYASAYAMLKKISSFKNNISMITTHFTDLSLLEQDTKQIVKNYKFYITRGENNDIVYPYIVKRGISKQYIAIELLGKNGMDKDIIDEALRMCSEIKLPVKRKKQKQITTKKPTILN